MGFYSDIYRKQADIWAGTFLIVAWLDTDPEPEAITLNQF
jgi:hypothetical protein